MSTETVIFTLFVCYSLPVPADIFVPKEMSPPEITKKPPMVAQAAVYSNEEWDSPVLILVRLLAALSVYGVIYVHIE